MQPWGSFSGTGGRQPVMTLQITCTMFGKGDHAPVARLQSCVSTAVGPQKRPRKEAEHTYHPVIGRSASWQGC